MLNLFAVATFSPALDPLCIMEEADFRQLFGSAAIIIMLISVAFCAVITFKANAKINAFYVMMDR